MVVETVDQREQTSKAIIEALADRSPGPSYAIDLAKVLEDKGFEPMEAISTIWRLIDENRLFLDKEGHLVLEAPERD